MFMPDAGPAAIAVALPGELNYCWDAGACRLRYAWSGPFIDASKYWSSNGNHRAEPLGLVGWRAGPSQTVFAGARQISFLGYSLQGGIPSFRYKVDEVEVTERIEATDRGRLRVSYTSGGTLTLLGPGAGALTQDGPVPSAGIPLVSGRTVTLEIPLEAKP
jgi:hypothetical protein